MELETRVRSGDVNFILFTPFFSWIDSENEF
jgi:hypothetical protein